MPTGPRTKPGDLDTRIARLLDVARKAQGVSQTDLAERAGVSQSQLSKLLRGAKPMTLTEFLALCGALQLAPSAVMTHAEAVDAVTTEDA